MGELCGNRAAKKGWVCIRVMTCPTAPQTCEGSLGKAADSPSSGGAHGVQGPTGHPLGQEAEHPDKGPAALEASAPVTRAPRLTGSRRMLAWTAQHPCCSSGPWDMTSRPPAPSQPF